MATHPEGLDHTQDFNLLLLMLGADRTGRQRLRATLILRQQAELVTYRRVRNIGGDAPVNRELLEEAAPLFRHRVRIVQIELIELFDVGSVTTG